MLLPAEIPPHGQTTEPAAHAVCETVLGALSLAWVARIGHGLGAVALPIKSPGARTGKAVRLLMENGHVRAFDQWRENPGGWSWPPALQETSRCAQVIINRFFT